MKRVFIVAVITTLLSAAFMLPSFAAPTVFRISFPLHIGGHVGGERGHLATAAEMKMENRLRLARYGFQLADAIVSAIGYKAYARCLSCLAYPGGGPLGSAPLSVANLSGDRPAESDPLIQPFSRGGIVSLALGALAYDVADDRIERHWSIKRRATADAAEIGAHMWGISTWFGELKSIHRDTAIATACGAQWRAREFGAAFSDGCVNEYYRAGPLPAQPAAGAPVTAVCAPAQFKAGTYLFATPDDYVIASGVPCANLHSPFP